MRPAARTAVAVAAGLYGLLLVASRVADQAPEPRDPLGGYDAPALGTPGPFRVAVEVPPTDDDGPLAGPQARLSLLHWPGEGDASRAPVVCVHGSPGSATNFTLLAPQLARLGGREVWAIDLPGFGRSAGPVGGYSILAHARSLLAALDALEIERAHLVAWSMGGGVVLHAADLAPERVASLTLIASIGVQETEGTGSHTAEHLKYLGLRALIAALDLGLPHFGRWARGFEDARAFALNFEQTDQRPLAGVLERLRPPLLVLHGTEDVLASARAALETHARVEASRLVLYEANHFLPVMQVDWIQYEIDDFLERHDAPGTFEPRSQQVPERLRAGPARLDPWPFELAQRIPWWLQAAAILTGVIAAPFAGGFACGLALVSLQADPGWTLLVLVPAAALAAWRRRRVRTLFGVGLAVALGFLLGALGALAWSRVVGPTGASLRGALLAGATASVLWLLVRRAGRRAPRTPGWSA